MKTQFGNMYLLLACFFFLEAVMQIQFVNFRPVCLDDLLLEFSGWDIQMSYSLELAIVLVCTSLAET